MAGDEDKKKKKKSKKAAAEEAPPPPPPEPEPEPPAAAPAAEGDTDDWLSAATAEEPSQEVPAEAPPAEGGEEALLTAEGEELALEGGELPPQPKKKPKFFVHWDRRKAKFYDYNFDYGSNYYASMVGYVDKKNQGAAIVPRRMAFAERGMYSSLERSRNPDLKTQTLLNDVRNSIKNFERCQKVYASKAYTRRRF